MPRIAPPEPQYPLDAVLDFMRLLWAIEHGLQRMSKRMARELGVTGPQRLVLRVISQYPGLSARQLAHIVRLHPSTITGVVQRLVDRGLIDRRRDRVDTRRIRLTVRPQARRYTRPAPRTVEAAVRVALRRSGASNVRIARRVLDALAERLNDL